MRVNVHCTVHTTHKERKEKERWRRREREGHAEDKYVQPKTANKEYRLSACRCASMYLDIIFACFSITLAKCV